MTDAHTTEKLPSFERQKDYIAEHGPLLSVELRRAVLALVLQEVGEFIEKPTGERVPVVVEVGGRREVNVFLDAIESPELICHVYNVVHSRVELLGRPAGGA